MARLTAALSMVVLMLVGPTAHSDAPIAARVVREEALRPQLDPGGRPLPLVAHWHRMSLPLTVQIQLIREGHPLLPWIDYHRSWNVSSADVDALATLRTWNLPLTLITGGQWEADFYSAAEYQGLPVEQTGLADDLAGNPLKMVSPFSPVEPWRTLGRLWTNNAAAKAIQAAYPDPPRAFFVSNNEAQDLRWHQAETSKAYVDAFGLGRADDFKRKVFGDGWIARYSALFQGMRDGLPAGSWRENSRFVGYNAFGPDHWGRWDEWKRHALVTEDRVSPEWYAWNGASVEAYDNDWEPEKTAFRLWSTQTEMMNLVFQKEASLSVQPEFWFELIFWDGNQPGKSSDKYALYQSLGIEYTPAVYSGWTQYSLWLLVPRVAREWRKSDDNRERWWGYFEQIIAGVERVHIDPVLKKFWRNGELVPNTSRSHPFIRDLPSKWINVPRWYQLNTSVDPLLPAIIYPGADYKIQLPVWTLARVLGTKPNREWLIYAHAPLGEKTDVTVDLPEYQPVKLPRITVGGSFFHVVEATGAISEVGLVTGPLKEKSKPAPPPDFHISKCLAPVSAGLVG